MKILAISGSLRASSSNAVLLCAASRLAPAGVEVHLYSGWGDLPHFNPDLDGTPEIPAVADWRRQLQESAAVLISCPEYAHGVPGAFKNALDWVVGSGEFVNKPVALMNPSGRGVYAHASLVETLTTMMARIVTEASISLNILTKPFDEASILSDPERVGRLRSAVGALADAA